ncbi:MAG: MBL fold metallo-hydrolase [Parasporobacterium sp.]|nr:MBL fold metallo-hydrolase [Parasporobacterium sp.]
MNRNIIKIDSETIALEDDFVRCFLVIGEKYAAWIDSGVSSPDLISIAAEFTSLPLLLINTHGDGDHTSSNGLFKEYYIHEDDYAGCGMGEKYPSCRMLPLHDGDEIDLGNRVLKIIANPGHTAGSISVIDVKKRRVFAGDMVQTDRIFLFGEHRRPEMFSDALAKLQGYSDMFDEILASHGTMQLPGEYISCIQTDWNEVCKGNAEMVPEELFGQKIYCAAGKYCSFLVGRED